MHFPKEGVRIFEAQAHTAIWDLGKLGHFSAALQGGGFCSYNKELFPHLSISATQLSFKKNPNYT